MNSYITCIWVVEIENASHTVISSGSNEEECRKVAIDSLDPGDEISDLIDRIPDEVLYGPNEAVVIV